MDEVIEGIIEGYSKAFPNYPKLIIDKNWLYGFWMIGNYYKRKHGYYGEYPPSYLKRIKSMFPNCKNVMHLFSGTVEKGLWEKETTVDILEKMKPDICVKATELSSKITERTFDLILADPPYEQNHKYYGTEKVNKRLVLHELAKVTISGGYLVWLDTRIPIYTKKEWKFFGIIGISTGTNRILRAAILFKRV